VASSEKEAKEIQFSVPIQKSTERAMLYTVVSKQMPEDRGAPITMVTMINPVHLPDRCTKCNSASNLHVHMSSECSMWEVAKIVAHY
jgi:hypothetical protein